MARQTPRTIVTTYSIESIFLGMNCVLYGFCAYMLWGQKSLSCRSLLFTGTTQFLLCVAQVAIHGIFLFTVFTLPPGNAQAYLQRVNGYILTAAIIYNITFLIGGLLSMWRLYVLYDNHFRVCVPAFIIWIGELCASGVTIYICATTPLISANFNFVNMLLWAFITTLNLYVAIPICFRLCMAQRRTHTILSRSPYKSIAIIFVECGALITLGSVVMLILYARNYIYALANLGVATQLAVASQFLITARHAMLSHDRDTCSPSPSVHEINMMPTESRDVGEAMTPTKTKTPSFAPQPDLQDKNVWQPSGDV